MLHVTCKLHDTWCNMQHVNMCQNECRQRTHTHTSTGPRLMYQCRKLTAFESVPLLTTWKTTLFDARQNLPFLTHVKNDHFWRTSKTSLFDVVPRRWENAHVKIDFAIFDASKSTLFGNREMGHTSKPTNFDACVKNDQVWRMRQKRPILMHASDTIIRL